VIFVLDIALFGGVGCCGFYGTEWITCDNPSSVDKFILQLNE
jgi:hypothetical protein